MEKQVLDRLRRPGVLLLAGLIFATACSPGSISHTRRLVRNELGKQQGTFAVAFLDVTTGQQLTLHGHRMFHAASTMKTPVMIEVFKQAAAGQLALRDSMQVKNEFRSLVDGSPYHLHATGDSEQALYALIGTNTTIEDLVQRMITSSSNLATNLVLQKVGARNVTETMRAMGAQRIQVLRGVEDSLAFALGLNNKTSAIDLMTIFSKIARREAVNAKASDQMMEILFAQKFNEIIPAGLPPDVKVAHKTGSLTGVHHDSGIIVLPGDRRFVLVILSRDVTDEKSAIRAMTQVVKLLYQRHMADGR